ncbi:sigma-E factor negative regulatory protein [Massilia sp. TS11]|uniref:sigma-E factor negative regulatory protein n=1 Tax=Massilia sp. TS11 TaxID=2908003 RepID=UPI001EDAB167|nr:sigma-E factor negative regulatory protein [Massilia sp. TS11]MCG2583384.1 sigma-E factor negative regulatory protein [Massilia sp. TS11]
MDTSKKIREHISALGDGELPDEDVELGLAALRTEVGAAAWRSYHRIGDALRAAPAPELSAGFEAALAARLDQETPPHKPAARAPAAPASEADTAAPLSATGPAAS